jgi:hypothetical protein
MISWPCSLDKHSTNQFLTTKNAKSTKNWAIGTKSSRQDAKNAKKPLLTGEHRGNEVFYFISVISVTSCKKIHFYSVSASPSSIPLRAVSLSNHAFARVTPTWLRLCRARSFVATNKNDTRSVRLA